MRSQLIDVREGHEWEAGRIAGARHVELGAVAVRPRRSIATRPSSSTAASAARSTMAANAFRQAGYDAYSMDGGIAAWAERGLPLDPDDGEVAEH